MYKYIILSSGLFGSLLENKKIPYKLIMINGLTFLVSGYIVVYNFSLLNLSNFKSSRI